MGKTWFLTGSSRGYGRRFAEAARSRGDKVIPQPYAERLNIWPERAEVSAEAEAGQG
jgi:NAD(P)-dependent dehydrogenase (short-subunit alcohol dehydrogenase family)